jgi:hypothetical protein
MESPSQQRELRHCDNCREVFFTRGSREKCLECSITTIHDNGVIQFPDRHFYGDEEVSDDEIDLTDQQVDTIPNFDSVAISEILTQDDPPQELYLLDDAQLNEILDDVDDLDEDTAWMLYYGDDIDKFNEYCDEAAENFCIYEHFGIPSDVDKDEAEALLEAAIPDR